jgi:hypothetical protein
LYHPKLNQPHTMTINKRTKLENKHGMTQRK